MGQDLGPHALESQQNGINEEYDDFWDTMGHLSSPDQFFL